MEASVMRIMPFRPPTEHYDERLRDIDEKISALVSERYAISEDNPGFPRTEYLNDWAQRYGMSVRLLQHLFAFLHRRPEFREPVNPDQFLRFVPVMAAKQQDGILVMIPYIRQYNNCSVVVVELEGAGLDGGIFHHLEVNLSLDGYEPTAHTGQSDASHASRNFIVTPPIPDDKIPHLNITVQFESRPIEHQDTVRHPIPPTTVRLSLVEPKTDQ